MVKERVCNDLILPPFSLCACDCSCAPVDDGSQVSDRQTDGRHCGWLRRVQPLASADDTNFARFVRTFAMHCTC